MKHLVYGPILVSALANLADISTIARNERSLRRGLDRTSEEILTDLPHVRLAGSIDSRERKLTVYRGGKGKLESLVLPIDIGTKLGQKMVYDPASQVEGVDFPLTYGSLSGFLKY